MDWDRILTLLDKVPWALLLTVFVIPYLRRLQTKIKDEELRRLYIRLVRWAEMKYGAGEGLTKKTAVENALNKQGLELDEVRLDAAVHEATKVVSANE